MDLIRKGTRTRDNVKTYRVCKWELPKPFQKRYQYTGFMRLNRVHLSVVIALQAKDAL